MKTPTVGSAVGPRRTAASAAANLTFRCVTLLFFGVLPQLPECNFFDIPSSSQLKMRPAQPELYGTRFCSAEASSSITRNSAFNCVEN